MRVSLEMGTRMKKLFFILILLYSTNIFASDVYVGFILGALSRGGLVIGYKIDGQNSVEVHLNGVPDTVSFGVSLIAKNSSVSRNALIVGYSKVGYWIPGSDKSFESEGVNIGYRHSNGKASDDRNTIFEIGGGPARDVETKEGRAFAFVGFGAINNRN